MAGHVGQRLLDNAVSGDFKVGRYTLVEIAVPELHLYTGLARIVFEIPVKRREQAQVIEDGGSQVQRQVTDLPNQCIKGANGGGQVAFVRLRTTVRFQHDLQTR